MKLFATAATILVVAVGTATAGTGPSSQGVRADALPWPATNGHYIQGVKAYGLRLQAMARFSAKPTPAVTAGNGFNWGDAGIGAAAGLVLAAFAGAAIVFVRNSRRTKLAL